MSKCQKPTKARVEVLVVERQPRRAALIAAMSIFFMPIIASNARFASSPPAASASVSTRDVICQVRRRNPSTALRYSAAATLGELAEWDPGVAEPFAPGALISASGSSERRDFPSK